MTEAQARRVLADIHQELHGERLVSSSVEDYFNRWIARNQVENSKSTYQSYKGISEGFLEFLGDQKKKDLAFLTPRHFTEYRDTTAKRVSVRTVNNYIKILRIVMKEAYRDGLIVNNPVDQVKTIRRKDQNGGRRGFSLPEVRKLLTVADTEWTGMILAGLYTGQRLGDLARLSWEDIDLQEAEISFTTVKTGRRIVIPIAPPLATHLKNLPPPDPATGPVFPRAHSIAVDQDKVSTLSPQFSELMARAVLAPF